MLNFYIQINFIKFSYKVKLINEVNKFLQLKTKSKIIAVSNNKVDTRKRRKNQRCDEVLGYKGKKEKYISSFQVIDCGGNIKVCLVYLISSSLHIATGGILT